MAQNKLAAFVVDFVMAAEPRPNTAMYINSFQASAWTGGRGKPCSFGSTAKTESAVFL